MTLFLYSGKNKLVLKSKPVDGSDDYDYPRFVVDDAIFPIRREGRGIEMENRDIRYKWEGP